jgi:hypothetical protein
MKLTLLAAITLALVGCSSSPSCNSPEAVEAEFTKHLGKRINDTITPKLQDIFGSTSLEVYPEITEFKLSDLMTLDEKDGVRYCKARLKTTKSAVLKLPVVRSELGFLINGLSLPELARLKYEFRSSPIEKHIGILKQVLVNKVVIFGFKDVSTTANTIIGKSDISNDKDVIEYSLKYSDDRKAIYVELLK